MKIAVIGAGICGLTFAASIKKLAKFPVELTLYERDFSQNSRAQGYAIGLNQGFALSVLQWLDLLEPVVEHCHSQLVNDFLIQNWQGTELFSSRKMRDESRCYRVQRQWLKSVLNDAIGDYPILYGYCALDYTCSEEGVTVFFANGISCQADYVIACDGASSKLRQIMIGDEKHFLGLASINGLSLSKIKHAGLDGGYYMGLGKQASMFIYRQPRGVYYSYTHPVAHPGQLDVKTRHELLEVVSEKTQSWCDFVKEIVSASQVQSMSSRAYHDRNPASRLREANLWLIGDAAHLMSPFKGLGANLAMLDAYQLAQTMVTGGLSRPECVNALEQKLLTRGNEAILNSRQYSLGFHQLSHEQTLPRALTPSA